MTGRLIHENTNDFFDPLFNWSNKFIESPSDRTVLNIKLIYISQDFIKVLISFLRKLIEGLHNDKVLVIKWYCEKDDYYMKETINLIKESLDFNIEIIEVEKINE